MSEEIRKTEIPAEAEAFDQAAMDEVMKKYDRESNTRVWEGRPKWVVYGVMAAFSLFVIYVTLFASWLDLIRYPSFMGGVLLIGYLVFPVKKGAQKVNHIPWFDWILMLAGSAAFFYAVVNAEDLTVRLGMSQLRPYEIVIAVVGWAIFYETDLHALAGTLRALLGYARDPALGRTALPLLDETARKVIRQYSVFPLLAFVCSLPVVPAAKKALLAREKGEKLVSAARAVSTALLYALCLMFLVGQSYNPFIYFRF